jgi:hypothetical protein
MNRPVEVTVKLSVVSCLFLLLTSGCATGVGTAAEEDAGKSTETPDAGKDTGTPVKKVVPEAGTPDTGTTDDDGSVVQTDTTCDGEATQSTCEQCCISIHSEGYATYANALDPCLCTSPGACASECATEECVSMPVTPGDACDTCINGALAQTTGACYGAVAAACQVDTDCMDLFGTCIPPCETK